MQYHEKPCTSLSNFMLFLSSFRDIKTSLNNNRLWFLAVLSSRASTAAYNINLGWLTVASKTGGRGGGGTGPPLFSMQYQMKTT